MDNKKRIIQEVFRETKGYARTKELVTAGIHPRDIRKFLEADLITKVKNGLYRLSDFPMVSEQSFIDIARAIPEGVICLLSALSHYELTTFVPTVISVAIHRKAWKPKIEYPPVEYYYFSTRQFKAGIDKIKMGGTIIKIYSREKTLCDCFRYRNKLGIDMVKEGLTEYLKRKDRNLDKMLEYAEICRIKSQLMPWLNAMI